MNQSNKMLTRLNNAKCRVLGIVFYIAKFLKNFDE